MKIEKFVKYVDEINNEKITEKQQLKILTKKFESVQYMNDIIKFYSDNKIPIKIKTCKCFIKSANKKNPKRLGRFIIDKYEHELLINNDGYYLFLVFHENIIISGKLIPSGDVSYKRQYTWREFLEVPKFGIR